MAQVTYDRVVHMVNPNLPLAKCQEILAKAFVTKQSFMWSVHDGFGNVVLVDEANGQQYVASKTRKVIFWGYTQAQINDLILYFAKTAPPASTLVYEIGDGTTPPPATGAPFTCYPVAGEGRVITQAFGANPANYAQFGLPGHEGLDLRAPTGTLVVAVDDGVVQFADNNPDGSYGRYVQLLHKDGSITQYAHLLEVRVSVNQSVLAGNLIGLANNSGNSAGSHLHLTLKRPGYVYTDPKGQVWPNNIFDPTSRIAPLMTEALATKFQWRWDMSVTNNVLRIDADYVNAVYVDGVGVAGHSSNTLSAGTHTVAIVTSTGARIERSVVVGNPPPPPPPPVQAVGLGFNMLNTNAGGTSPQAVALDAFAHGANWFLVIDDEVFAKRLADAVLPRGGRVLFRRWTPQTGSSPSASQWFDMLKSAFHPGVIVTAMNEGDQFGCWSADDFKKRWPIESELAQRCAAVGQNYAGGAIAMGNPDQSQALADFMRGTYAQLYNTNPYFYWDYHSYWPNASFTAPLTLTGSTQLVKVEGPVGKDGHHASWMIDEVANASPERGVRAVGYIDPIWFTNRWHWFFTAAGFDPKYRKMVSGEGGIDEGGVGGVPAHNLSGDQVRVMCRAIKKALNEQVMGMPSPMLGVAMFTGHPNDPKWTQGYGMSQYMDYLEF